MAEQNKETMDRTKVPAAQEAERAPRFDVERYLPMTEGFDISEDDKREFLETLWNILVTITDLGLGLDPVQMLLGTSQENSTVPAPNVVKSTHSKRQDFECAVSSSDTTAGKDSA